MFPLKVRQLIRGCQAHINAGLGCGSDHTAALNTDLFAPFDGTLERFSGVQGGNWVRIIRPNGDRIEFAHLNSYVKPVGPVKEGELIARTGNTGSVTTGPHLHTQILRNGVRLDPEKYMWDTVVVPTCEQQLAAEKAAHAESIKEKELNYQRWQTELDLRKDKEKQLVEKIAESKLNFDNWQKEIDARKALDAKVNQIKGIVNA